MARSRTPVGTLSAALIASALLSCGRSSPSSTAVDFRHDRQGGTPVARFGGDAITSEELSKRFAEMSPYARARYQSAEQKKEYLEGLARFELLAQEALRQGLQNDPEVVETAKKVMVQRLMAHHFDESQVQLTDAELHDYYLKHQSDYQKPEVWRLAHVFLAAPAQDSAARSAKQKKAEEILAQAKALDPVDFAGFGKLARASSEEPRTQPLDGDMRYLSAAELKAQYGDELAAAAPKLLGMGQLSLVATPKGFHVLKLEGHQNALDLSEAQVKDQLRGRLLFERRQAAYEAYVAELKKKSDYTVDEQALAGVKVDPSAPTEKASGPTPGFLPPSQPSASAAPASR